MGDANGVGPEIVLKSARDGILDRDCIVYGDRSVLAFAAGELGLPARLLDGIATEDLDLLDETSIRPGEIDAGVGAAAVGYIQRATHDAMSGSISGIVTLPINKAAVQLTRPGFTGHTEFIADLCGVRSVTMMLASERLMALHVSTHVSLARAIGLATTERILEVIRLADQTARLVGKDGRIAVAAINPHAGEHGAFGAEDDEQVRPAVVQAQREGINVVGPESADTVFYNAIHRDRFDAVVCMYHDQGHIAMKTLDFHGAVNVTLGLPVVRTSVDHGTAYDIAYQGLASTDNFARAVEMARRLSG